MTVIERTIESEVATRMCCVWCPGWQVVALRRSGNWPCDIHLVVFDGPGPTAQIVALEDDSHESYLRVGMRRREAKIIAPWVSFAERESLTEAQAFEDVARAIETLTPRIEMIRPGLILFPTRGPSRYHGGDEALAVRVTEVLGDIGVSQVRVGIADGAFAARLAARVGKVIMPAASPEFLSHHPIDALGGWSLGNAALADLCHRLGLHTLADFAGLAAADVVARFGTEGLAAHRLARGLDVVPPHLGAPPPDLAEVAELDPPTVQMDVCTFAAKGLADRITERLGVLGLSCTRIAIEAETEHGEHLTRTWHLENGSQPGALIERVRWQLEGWFNPLQGSPPRGSVAVLTGGAVPTGGITRLRLVPDEVISTTGRQIGLFGIDEMTNDRVARTLARIQGILGHAAVVTLVTEGGRTPDERVRSVPWGEPREHSGVTAPWPGQIPSPAPAVVFEDPPSAQLLDARGQVVVVDGRGNLSAPPKMFRCEQIPNASGEITSWAGPWPQDLRWWGNNIRRSVWQIATAQAACLVALSQGEARVIALYD